MSVYRTGDFPALARPTNGATGRPVLRRRRSSTAIAGASGAALTVLGLVGAGALPAGAAAATGPSAAAVAAAAATCAAVAIGDSGPAVAAWQRIVGASPDGSFGPLTRAATQRWQTARHLPATGALDAATWAALSMPAAAAVCGSAVAGLPARACPTVSTGARGPRVAVIQRRLGLVVDGVAGPATAAGVAAAQQRLHLPVTGATDVRTATGLGLAATAFCPSAPAAVAAPAPPPATTAAEAAAQAAAARAAAARALAVAAVESRVNAAAAVLRSSAGTTTDPTTLTALRYARAQTGTRYVWGGAAPGGFDCSGLVQWSYAQAGLVLPRVAAAQAMGGVQVPLAQARAGDLLFWASDVLTPSTTYHVAVYLGQGMVLDAPQTGQFVGARALWTTGGLLPVAVRPVAGLVLPVAVGASGASVADVQSVLRRTQPALAVDGGFGPMTLAAVRAAQAAARVPVTGVVDSATWLAITRDH